MSEDEFLSKARAVPLTELNWARANRKKISISVRRDDLVDEQLSGNKFYKLFYNLKFAAEQGAQQILTFGGAYSNHIHALAFAAKRYGFKAIGVIRGERGSHLSPTLRDAEQAGMVLHFIPRTEYSKKESEELLASLRAVYGEFFVIPEGGANTLGLKGTQALGVILNEQLSSEYSTVCLAAGTGNSLAGVASGFNQANNTHTRIMGFSVLKGGAGLGGDIIRQQLMSNSPSPNWSVISGFHGGGYGKKLPIAMLKFLSDFEQETQLRLDPIYTLKLCWGIAHLIDQNFWPPGSRIVLMHTGGLQGRRGFQLT